MTYPAPAPAQSRMLLRSTPLSPIIPSKSPSLHTSTTVTPLTSPAPNTAALPSEWVDKSNGYEKPAAVSSVSTPAPTSMSNMSKEEKAAEMARRREERKQVRLVCANHSSHLCLWHPTCIIAYRSAERTEKGCCQAMIPLLVPLGELDLLQLHYNVFDTCGAF